MALDSCFFLCDVFMKRCVPMKSSIRFLLVFGAALLVSAGLFLPANAATDSDDDAKVAQREAEFSKSMENSVLVGTFTVDGVITADGFWPTELNPRFGAGINAIARASGLPILIVNDLVVGGHDLGRSATLIEEELVERADAHRGGGTWMGGLTHRAESDARVVDSSAVTIGPSFVRCIYDPASTPTGPSTAQRACDFWAFADREFGTEIGPLIPAPDLSSEQ